MAAYRLFFIMHFISKRGASMREIRARPETLSNSETTLKAYDLILNDFLIKVRKELEDITSNDIMVYLYESQEIRNVSLRTVENWRKVINAFFGMVSWRMIYKIKSMQTNFPYSL